MVCAARSRILRSVCSWCVVTESVPFGLSIHGGRQAELAERARTLDENFDSLLVFAITRPEAASADESNDAIQAFEKALALASRLDVEHSVELVVYVLARLQAKYGARVRESVLQNTSPVWSALRQAVSHADDAAVPDDPRVAGLVKALRSPLPPREQLLTSWKTGSP